IITINLINDQLNNDISCGQWLLYAGPWSILMSIALYFIMLKVMPPEEKDLSGGKSLIQQQLKAVGPVSSKEWRLIGISIILLILWSTVTILPTIISSSLI